MGALKSYFGLDSEASLRTEIRAGLTTFLTMSYILLVNPMILSQAGMNPEGVLTATVLVTAVSSVLMGLMANLPFALAPGMGLNSFFTYSLVIGNGISWQTALGATFISGVIFLFLTVLNVRKSVAQAIPMNLRIGIGCGIGLFISLIGLKESHVVTSHAQTLVSLATPSLESLLFWIGLFVTAWLAQRGSQAALITGILVTAGLGWCFGINQAPAQLFSSPDFSSVFLQLDIVGAMTYGVVGPIFTMVMTDMLDSVASFVGMSHHARLLDQEGQPLRVQSALFVDAIATSLSGLFGTSAATVYIESSSGVRAGGKTGITAIVCGLMFLPFLFLSPLAEAIPRYATAPALLLIGLWMLKDVRDLELNELDEAIPAYLAMIMTPLTYSITNGIVFGFISFCILKLARGKKHHIHPMMLILTLLCALTLWPGFH